MKEDITTCPQCGSEKESICIMEMDNYPLMIDGVVMPLRIAVPVERCQDCHFAWTDYQAEDIRDAVYSIYYPGDEYSGRGIKEYFSENEKPLANESTGE